KQVSADYEEVPELKKQVGELGEQLRANGQAWFEDNEKLKKARNKLSGYRPTADEVQELQRRQAEREAKIPGLRKQQDDLMRTLQFKEKRPSLYYGDKPWTRMPLIDASGKPIKDNI